MKKKIRLFIEIFALLLLLSCCTLVQAEEWVPKSDAPCSGGYGEAVIGTDDNIYIAKCMYATKQPSFWCYDPDSDSWTSISTSGLPSGAFRSGMAMTWDHGDYIYALFGGRYSDTDRKLFYRYSISGDVWEQLTDTPQAQGAGDALTWSEHDSYIYGMIGNNVHGTVFARYSYDSWEILTLNPNWIYTEDGASLVSVDEYLYALQGEYDETVPNGNFARYHILSSTWEDMNPIPEIEGVGDGASLLWVGDRISKYHNTIFAFGGGETDEDPGYNFYQFNITSNTWDQLESIPCPVGYYVGNRIGYVNSSIYYWQGAPSTWDCGGDAFYMYELDVTHNDNWREEWIGEDTPEGSAITTGEVQNAIHHWLEDLPVRGYTLSTMDLQEVISLWLSE